MKKVLFERVTVIGGTEYRDDFVQRSLFFDVSPPAPGIPKLSDTYNWGVYLQADAAAHRSASLPPTASQNAFSMAG